MAEKQGQAQFKRKIDALSKGAKDDPGEMGHEQERKPAQA